MNKEKTLTPEEIVENMYSIGPDNFEGLSELFVTKSDAIDALEKYGQQEFDRGKTEAQQWISVEDELPEYHEGGHSRYVWAHDGRDTFRVRYWYSLKHWDVDGIIEWTDIVPPSAPTQGKETI